MLKNCDNQFKFGQFRSIKCTATNNHHIDQIKNKPQDLLVNTSSATRSVARNFIRAEENNSRVQHLNTIFLMLLVFNNLG